MKKAKGRMVSEQQRLFSKLEGNGWEIRRGKMSKNTEFGRCEGFYFFEQKIENNEELKKFSESILKEYQFHYSPLIIVSRNNQNWESLQDSLGNAQI